MTFLQIPSIKKWFSSKILSVVVFTKYVYSVELGTIVKFKLHRSLCDCHYGLSILPSLSTCKHVYRSDFYRRGFLSLFRPVLLRKDLYAGAEAGQRWACFLLLSKLSGCDSLLPVKFESLYLESVRNESLKRSWQITKDKWLREKAVKRNKWLNLCSGGGADPIQ